VASEGERPAGAARRRAKDTGAEADGRSSTGAHGQVGGQVDGQVGGQADGQSVAAGDLAGPELARAVLDAAQARRQAARPRRRAPEAGDEGDRGDGGARYRKRGYSGPGPDPRDPQLFGVVLARLVKARGWSQPAAEATVFGAWERVVGPDIAAHSRPVKLTDGELTVEAESTAWATQLRMLAASLLRRIAAEVGHNVVKKLHIHGPSAPSWGRGPRRVQGRGPRDTYG
jgi:predicted nucleic acid-binding Zn ribbon protein